MAVTELGLTALDLTAEEFEAWTLTLDEDEIALLEDELNDPDLGAYARSRQYVDDPGNFAREVLHEHAWSKQQEIGTALVEHRYVAVPSCHGAGKSWWAARLVAWWLSSHPPGEAFVVTTAPTGDQVRGILWREINRAHAKGALPGRVNLSQWYINGELVAIGRKPANTNAAAFQGLHAEFILVVIDEADGVAPAIFDAAADTLATNDAARVLAIGNPDSGQGPFFDACQPGSDWHVIRISAFDTPNFTGEDVPEQLRRVLVSKQWVEERERKWGLDDPRYSSKVLAIPPVDNPFGVMPYSQLLACMRTDPDDLPQHTFGDGTTAVDWDLVDGESVGGLDVGGGGDLTVIWERRGRMLARRWAERNADPVSTVANAVRFIKQTGMRSLKVDVVGIGHGIAGHLESLRRDGVHDCKIVRVNVSKKGKEPSTSTPGFPKLRDEIWWMGHDLTLERRWDLSVLGWGDEHEGAVQELIKPTWEPDASGRIHVMSKDELRKKIGRSPDDADAILLAYFEPVVGSKGTAGQITGARI